MICASLRQTPCTVFHVKMYFNFLHSEFIEDMGYSMSKLEADTELLDGSSSNHGATGSARHNTPSHFLDHEIAQLTKLRSGPHENISRILPGKREVPVSTFKMLAAREANYSGRGRFSKADSCHVLSKYLPVNGPWIVDQMATRAYVSQFSVDGSLFVAAFQGSHIRIYDVERGWKVQKNILAKSLRWTVTDTSLSPGQRHLVYATMSPIVHIVNVGSAGTESLANITEIHDGLDLAADEDDSFGIFSVKFSTDGREVVAGSSDDAIYVYDLEANKLSLRISAHESDVNSVCFADESGHLIYSGSDDNLCKVWDRRCFRAKEKPAGVQMGHLEGITFLDSRGDGRYFISNGKDQAIKLWDIRKMSTKSTCNMMFRHYEWDYRWMDYPPQARDLKHPFDHSVATYKGHSVLRTLIRCYFSPEYSTGQRYIYTGSHDTCIYIYDLVSGEQVAKLEHHGSTVRDCSWHPHYPMLVSSSWDGDVVKWEFPGDGEEPVPPKKKPIRRRRFV
ncbi:PREDICTED: LEC14B protein [Nicotiana attenuata]|uniref:LEC14B homolog n=1 Tax=Nicotiana attenuata TaxID=49451 RepID=A0A1J6IQ37_NICAT|nr:PREDICTED: LEC14B protein [Nicotiana attenuata]OIT06950.1 lec14b-like protein [Nicotiana attenuata]